MKKHYLGLDIGTNSIGWALVAFDTLQNMYKIVDMSSRIIPMNGARISDFEKGLTVSATANRTFKRSVRRLYQRDNLRRERLHRVLHKMGFLPKHYAAAIDFKHRLGQFLPNTESKIAYSLVDNSHQFLFQKSFNEMLQDFRERHSDLVYNGNKIPYDWTIYFLRKKALSQKIDKEELAWILLNFNQKRGYYQLRGESENIEEENGKSRTFETLKVSRVEDSGETLKVTNEQLYRVFFSNGWEYENLIKFPVEWEGKTKEFIVTTSILKDGQTKRKFKAVDSESDWLAIKSKTEQTLQFSGKTVGEYIYDALLANPAQKIRGKLIRTIERKFYKNELVKILAKQQEFHPELADNQIFEMCIEELYPFNENHKAGLRTKNLSHLLIEDILFYQRPLKSKKSLIANCSLEQRYFQVGNDWKQEPIKCIAKSNPYYQEFRLLQFLKNLRIYERGLPDDRDITTELLPTKEARWNLFSWLNDKSEITQKDLLKYSEFQLEDKLKECLSPEDFKIYKKDKEKGLGIYFRWNYVQDKKYPLNETRGEFIKRFQKLRIPLEKLDRSTEQHLWHILYSVETTEEVEKALTKFASAKEISDDFVGVFMKFPSFQKDYGTYSEKAIKRLLSLMRFGSLWSFSDIDERTKRRIEKIITGEANDSINERVRKKANELTKESDFQELDLWLASYIIYNRHAETSEIQQWNTPDKICLLEQHSLRNPIVEQVINETLQLVKAIWLTHGQGRENFFDEIHVELGREMKNPADKRKAMSEKIAENEQTNYRLKCLLMEFANDPAIEQVRPYSPMQHDILKIYEDGIYQSETNQDTLKEIDTIRKKTQPTAAELTRYKLWLQQGYRSPYTGATIPLSKLFTTAYQIEHIIPQSRFFDDSLTNKVICESEVNALKDNKLAYEFIKAQAGYKVNEKIEIFSLEEYEEHVKRNFSRNKGKLQRLLMDNIPDAFIERQLNDTRYITKVVKKLLSNIVREAEEQEATSKNLLVCSGGITSKLKHEWGLTDVWNELITPRFQRLNDLHQTDAFGKVNPVTHKFLPEVPFEHSKGFNKKRIDHRHHALDALIIACTTRSHVNYLNNVHAADKDKSERIHLRTRLRHTEQVKIINGREIQVAKSFIKPWPTFTQDARHALEKALVSYKQNLRILNKTTNKTQQWVKQPDASYKKELVKQTKGDAWAIRRSLHKETVSGKVNLADVKLGENEITTATRKALDSNFTEKQLNSITSSSIKKILKNHLLHYDNNYVEAFSPAGLEQMNIRIKELNGGKAHHPIYKVRVSEKSTGKFALGETGNKKSKYVEADAGTNLYFGIYMSENGQRTYQTFSMIEVLERQKQGAANGEKPKDCTVPKIDNNGSRLLFTLSPQDIVYVPTPEEIENPALVHFDNLTREQIGRIYYVNNFTDRKIFFTPIFISKAIIPKEVDLRLDKNNFLIGSFDTKTSSLNSVQIRDYCWKLSMNRLGHIIKVER